MNDAYQRLEPLLRPGEQLRWSGRPGPKARFAKADAFLVPFSLFWAGFVVVWEWLAVTRDSPLLFVLFGIPFVLMGLYLVFGRFIYKNRRKRSTVYGLTDSRAIVSTRPGAMQDIGLTGVPVSTTRSRDGRRATVLFGNSPLQAAAYQNTGLDFFAFGSAQAVGFYDVAEPDELLRELNLVHR